MNLRRLLSLMAVVFIVGLASLLIDQTRKPPLRISGLIEADEIRAGSRVGGRVRQVLVIEGQNVKTGQTLVSLEPFDLNDKLSEARSQMLARQYDLERLNAGFREEEKALSRAKMAEAEASLNEAKSGPRKQEKQEAIESVGLADAQLLLAKQKFDRAKQLLIAKAVSPEEYDRLTAELKVAQQQLAVAKTRAEMVQEGTRVEQIAQAKARLDAAKADLALRERGYRTEDIKAAEANLQATKALLQAVERQLAELDIHAPVDAVVEAIDLQPGTLLAANAPALTLLNNRRLRVRAFLPEKLLGTVQEGKELSIVVDGFPDRRFKGKVTFIAREAEFTPTNTQTSDQRSKQVFRIKVDLIDGHDVLRAGMSTDIYLESAP